MVDTRIWNIAPLAALLAGVGCRPPPIAIDEDVGGETGSGEDGPSYCDDNPCPVGWLCIDDYGGYCYPQCYDDGECDFGEVCDDGSCVTVPDLHECEGPSLVELPIPAPAQGEVLDLHFGDLDGDSLDELLVLHPGELVVVRDGMTSSTVSVDPLADEVAVLHIDEDATLDVFLSSVEVDHAAALLGVGDGSLMPPEPRTLAGLQHVRALDWPDGGADEIVGVDSDAVAVRVSELATGSPTVTPIWLASWSTDTVVAIHPGDFDADGADDVLIHDVTSWSDEPVALLMSQLENQIGIKWFGFSDNESLPARSTAFARPSELGRAFVYALERDGETNIHVYFLGNGVDLGNAAAFASAEIRELAHVDGVGLVLATAGDTKIIEMDDLALGCVASPDALSASTRVVAGNFADNEGDEFALIDDQGVIRVWARLP